MRRKVKFFSPIDPASLLSFTVSSLFAEEVGIPSLRHRHICHGSMLSQLLHTAGLLLHIHLQFVHLASNWLEIVVHRLLKKVGLLLHEQLQVVYFVLKLLVIIVYRLLLLLLLLFYPRCVDGVRVADLQRLLRSAIEVCELIVVLVHLPIAVIDVSFEMAVIDVALHWPSCRMMPSHTTFSSC